MMDVLSASIIILIIVASALIFVKNKKLSIFVISLSLILMHKELFSIGVWDFLPSRFVILGSLLGLFFEVLKNRKFKSLIGKYSKDRVLLLLLGILITKILASLIYRTIFSNMQFVLFTIITISIYVLFKYLYEKNKEYLSLAINSYLFAGIVATLFAYVQLFLNLFYKIKIGAIWPVPKNFPRLGSSFWDVNHYGGFLITVIPISFMNIFLCKSKKMKVLNFVITAIFSFMLFLTQSRSSWLGVLVAFTVGLTLLFTRKHFKPIALTLIGILAMAGVFFTYLDFKDLSIKQKIASYMHYRLDSTDTHVMLLEGALKIYLEHPLIGVGAGNFDLAFRQSDLSEDYFNREPKLREQKVPPHSVWGEVLSETGYIGFVVFFVSMLFVLSGLVMSAFKAKNKVDEYRSYSLFIALLGILVTGIFYSYNLEFFWMLYAICGLFVYSQLKDEFRFKTILKWLSTNKYLPLISVVLIAICFIIPNLGGPTVIEWDESIYAKVAKNIYQTGDWMTLHWNSLDKNWYEKPPLYMWITALAFKYIGLNEVSVRIGSAVLGILGIAFTYLLGSKLYSRFTGIVASLMLLSTIHYLYYSRVGMLDVSVSTLILISIYLFYVGYTSSSKKIIYTLYILSGVFIGLAVMTKAIIGLLPLFAIIGLSIVSKVLHKRNLNIFPLIALIFTACLVFLPWHVAQYMMHGYSFLNVYLLEHIFDRGFNGLGHEKAIYWYAEVIKVSFRYWTFPLIGGVILLPFIDKKRHQLFLLMFMSILVFIFFSIPKDKLVWYIIPIYPYLSIISARFIDKLVDLINKVVKEEYTSISKNLRLYIVVVFTLFLPLYITFHRDMLFFDDINADIIKLVKVHNEIYPIDRFPELDLHYYRMAEAVLLFYSDHKPVYTSQERIIDMLKGSDPTEFNTFLLSKDRLSKVKILMDKEKFDFPVELRIKASSGAYVIARSYPPVEIYNERLEEIRLDVADLVAKNILVNTSVKLTNFEKSKIKSLNKEYDDIVVKLKEYGQNPPAFPTIQ